LTLRQLIERILLIVPTQFGIMPITFPRAQCAPGGPVERILARISAQGFAQGHAAIATRPGNDAR